MSTKRPLATSVSPFNTMATFQITIDDSLAPGIIATASLEGKTPEEVVNEYAEALANKVRN